MRIDGLWAADEDTIDVDPAERDPVRRDENESEPLKTGHEWDEPEESQRNTYDDIPCTD
jgi:hypothetical protein